ncbi:MAG: protein-glutamate O-methyltransferase CheR [Candidatus Eisenbacteria bacterium]|uniref:protein-glutamate O-methyltransferase n=1 Tax=Eiseniibacteriota bacterium TaxID=2212470 RepID=A0A956LW13_UNCEI|nr:protein-glutamate O-methyltransferase CheR [Candidatus Eisenbacteria bacterium]
MTLSASDYEFMQSLVCDRSAIVLEANKEYLVEARLIPVAKREGFETLADMIAALRKGAPALVTKCIEAMTTNETSFFRDSSPFEAMKSTIIPDLMKAREASRTINIWSAACSSGQEVYSLGMLLRESFPGLLTWNVQFLATDLAQGMVDRTAKGSFSQLEVNRGLPALLLVKYFNKVGPDWQIKDELRAKVTARQMNLAQEWRDVPMMDVVFLRNVLIYFSVETRRQILGRVKRVLKPDGTLFLGSAETTLNIDDSWERITINGVSCYRVRDANPAKMAA